jgi:hypothetical protein
MWSATFFVTFILIMLISGSAYVITGSTWYPFQSPEVRKIYEHITPSEKRELKRLFIELNFQIASPAGILIGLTVLSFAFAYSITIGLIFSGLFIVYILTLVRREIRAYYKRVREILCATGYARSRGYQPETLRIFAFPWNK